MGKPPAIVIFDVGKTNKKILVFDERLQLIYNRSDVLPETVDEDGFPCEDIEVLTRWVGDSFRDLSSKIDHDVKAVNFSAYGATLVHIVDDVKLRLPIYNYLKPYPGHLLDKFYASYGGEVQFCLDTASPALGNLNSGLQLYRIKKEQPEKFNKIRNSLHLPQFLSFIFTGLTFSEITSIGCHTALWDFSKKHYHSWVDREGVRSKLPAIVASHHTVTMAVGNGSQTIGVGLHDSSAALIPYITKYKDNFVLLSTGTWNISMNPFSKQSLTQPQLRFDGLCYLNHEAKPIKAARLFAGHVHEESVKKIAEHFHKDFGYHNTVDYSETIVTKLFPNQATAHPFDPAVMLRPGFFTSNRDLNMFKSFEDAYHQLMIDIVSFQAASTLLVTEPATQQLFVEGGFNKNKVFMTLLAKKFATLKVTSTDMPDASALGAAMVMGFPKP
jgi:L-fuculokinase